LLFAADEACRTQRPLHLVHVLRISGAEAYAGVVQGAYEAADAVVTRGLARARELVHDQVPVTAERVDEGWLVADLVDRASRGSMLVLQHRRQRPLRRLVTGSTVAGVASRCVVPVVSVPEDWHPGAPEAGVTVGVQDADEAGVLIHQALLEARARDARVVVLHAWYLDGGYDSVVADRKFIAERKQNVTRDLMPAIDAARADFRDVPVKLLVQHALTTGALVDHGSTSDLLVIGRRHHLLPLGSHLGPVARAVLQYGTGPVLLTPEGPREVPVGVEDPESSWVVQPA
jgi:nucleotide-binding universal stress UspA family protein